MDHIADVVKNFEPRESLLQFLRCSALRLRLGRVHRAAAVKPNPAAPKIMFGPHAPIHGESTPLVLSASPKRMRMKNKKQIPMLLATPTIALRRLDVPAIGIATRATT